MDMNALGVEIISCNIQRVDDENKLITILGQDNMSQIQKDASIAKANADRDIAIATAQAKRESNQAQVESDTLIAERNNELAIKKADLKITADAKQAEADAAYAIQEQEQRRSIETATINAEIAKAEREAELKKQEVAVQEETLNAEIRKKAEADRFAAEQQAQADRYRVEQAAEAEKTKRIMEAEAKLQEQLKEAEGIRAKGTAEAEAISAKGRAEAEAMDKKAEAMKKYGQAAITQMIVEKLPDIAGAVAKPYEQIDKITIIGGGDSGVNSVGSYIPSALAQTMAAMKEATGIDLKDLIEANGKDAKITRNVNITGLENAESGTTDSVGSAVVADTVSEMESAPMFYDDPITVALETDTEK